MLTIYDPTQDDSLGKVRGGGRTVAILRENLSEKTVRFVSDLKHVAPTDSLFIPIWQPFQRPYLAKKIAAEHILMLFDVIPIKYPEHFPIGLRGRWWLIHNLRALSLYDKIITISETSKADLVEYLNFEPEMIDVVYLTTSRVLYKPVKNSSKKATLTKWQIPSSTYFTYVGDTNWNKNLLNIAQAVIKSKSTLVCVGKAFEIMNKLRAMDAEEQHELMSTSQNINHFEQREFKEFIKLTLNDPHFVFPGYAADEELAHLYAHALANILISRDEGFGLSYLESARQSCPSILSDIPIFHEIAGDAAFFVDPENANALAKLLAQLSKKPAAYMSMKEKAFTRSKKFSPENFKKNMERTLV